MLRKLFYCYNALIVIQNSLLNVDPNGAIRVGFSAVGRSDAGYVWNLGSRSPCPVSVPKEAAALRLVLLCSSKCTGIMILEFGKNRFRLADKASDFLRCG